MKVVAEELKVQLFGRGRQRTSELRIATAQVGNCTNTIRPSWKWDRTVAVSVGLLLFLLARMYCTASPNGFDVTIHRIGRPRFLDLTRKASVVFLEEFRVRSEEIKGLGRGRSIEGLVQMAETGR